MATNDFKAKVNVTTQADWLALAALSTGFQSGKASSTQIDKALRQSTFVAAALANLGLDTALGGKADLAGSTTQIFSVLSAYGDNNAAVPVSLLNSGHTTKAELTGN